MSDATKPGSSNYIEIAADIVSAYVSKNSAPRKFLNSLPPSTAH